MSFVQKHFPGKFSRFFLEHPVIKILIVDRKNKTEFAFHPFISELKFRTNPGLSYNSPLNNPARRIKNFKMPHS